MRNSIFFIFLLLFTIPVQSQDMETDSDSLFFENHVSDFQKYQELPMGELMIKSAGFFMGKPYVGYTLDKNDKEELTVNLREFDCTTFVETCVALAGTIKSQDFSFKLYKYLLQMIRYRNGTIDGYPSRLHYMSDWIFNNQDIGVLKDITSELGGVEDKRKINFMTTHPDSYRQLKNNDPMIKELHSIEAGINERGERYFIPKYNIPEIEKEIKDGDIILFNTTIEGLDYSHIGIAYHNNGKLTFIHASTRSKSVIKEPGTLYDYCMNSSKCAGITVLRVNE